MHLRDGALPKVSMASKFEPSLWQIRERRRKARVFQVMPVHVRGLDLGGEEFRAHTILDNLSAGGLYMQLPRRLEPGSHLDLSIQYSDEWPSARIVASGIVRRMEEREGGLHGVAVEFIRFEFIAA